MCVQGAPKSNPLGKFDISGIIVFLFAKFTAFTEEDSGHIYPANFIAIFG